MFDYLRKEKDMKILYITMDGFDTPSPNNQMAEVMINDFLDNGYEVHLVQSRRTRKYADIPPSLAGKKGFTCDIVDREVFDRSHFVKRYIDELKYAFYAMKKWIKVKDADVIFLQSNPTVLLPMLLLKIFKRLPLLYCIYDVWPGHAYDIGVVKSKFLYEAFRLLNKPSYRLADKISVLSEDMRRKVIEEGAREDKVHVVPAWFDVKTAREIDVEENRFIKKYNIPTDKFYVQFAGTIGYVFNRKTVIELAKRLADTPQIKIQIVGDGNVKEKFVDEVKAEGLENIEFYPLQPIEIVPDVYSACNLCLIPLQNGVIGYCVPSKAPILMVCNRVIVNSVELDSEYAKMFGENNMGIAVDTYDYDGLASSVKMLYENPQTVKTMAENAHKFGVENYSSTMSTRKFMDIFDEMGEKKK